MYWSHNFLQPLESSPKSPESKRTPILWLPNSIIALPTIIVLRIPDYSVEYVSIKVVKLSGNAIAKFKNEANYP